MVSGSPDWWMQGRLSVISTPAESVEWVAVYDDSPANPGDYKSMVLRAATGYIYEVIAMRLSCAANYSASSGFHRFEVMSENAYIPVTYASASYNNFLSYHWCEWVGTYTSVHPSDATAQLLCIRGLRADSENGIIVEYFNGSNATQTSTRWAWFWLRKIKVSEI